MIEAVAGVRSAEIVDGELVLTLNNTMAAIEDGRQAILRLTGVGALDPMVVNRLEVVFEEVVSNIVRHGFSPGSEHAIVVRVSQGPTAIHLTFEDDGAPFDPLSAPERLPFRSLETAQLGGLGVSLVRKLAASVRYERPARDASAGFQPNNRLDLSIMTG